jgi:hypothetical protein
MSLELYKAKSDGVITKKNTIPNAKSGEEVAGFVKKGELILVKKTENLIDEKLSVSYKKYTLYNNKYAVSIPINGVDNYSKASFADVPEYLLIQLKKPRVYIVLGVLLAGLVIRFVIDKKNN